MNKEKLETLKQTAIENLERDGYLAPVVILEKRDGTQEMIMLDYKDETSKHMTQMVISSRLKSGEYQSFVHISEAFMVARDKEKFDKNIRASEEPDRQDVIVISSKNDSGQGELIMIPFIKDKSYITILYEQIKHDTTDDTKMGGNVWEMWQ